MTVPVNKLPAERSRAAGVDIRQRDTPLSGMDLPANDWIHFRLFTSERGGERILREAISNLVRDLAAHGEIDQWHFNRYSEPDYHLEVKLLAVNVPGGYLALIDRAKEVFNPLLDKKLVHKIQLELFSSQAEIFDSRMPGESEEVFTIDSEACLAFIGLAQDYEERDERWLWALRAIDMLLDVFYVSTGEKHKMVRTTEQRLKDSLSATGTVFRRINQMYKLHETEIDTLLSGNGATDGLSELLCDSMEVLHERQRELTRVFSSVKGYRVEGSPEPGDQAGHYIQLFINRLFYNGSVNNELMLYSMLNRYYSANLNKTARQGQLPNSN
jgi:thiopeptide-type bacteriocin biosynthesis protein